MMNVHIPHLFAFPSARRAMGPAVLLISLVLSGCGITIKTTPGASLRNMDSAKKAAVPTSRIEPGEPSAQAGLRLARLLRDQGRYEGAAGVYAQLEQRGELKPLELLEYASVAANVRGPQEALALFGRARRALSDGKVEVPPSARATLCNGLGRARLALGQRDAALGDFECALAAVPDDVTALNGKAVLLDAQGDHEQARQLLVRANELDPADVRVQNNLALSYLSAGDVAQAVRLLSQGGGSLSPSLRLNLALAQTLHGQDEQARKTLRGFLPAERAEQAMRDFVQRRQRIRAGEPVAQELLAASNTLLPLTERGSHE